MPKNKDSNNMKPLKQFTIALCFGFITHTQIQAWKWHISNKAEMQKKNCNVMSTLALFPLLINFWNLFSKLNQISNQLPKLKVLKRTNNPSEASWGQMTPWELLTRYWNSTLIFFPWLHREGSHFVPRKREVWFST